MSRSSNSKLLRYSADLDKYSQRDVDYEMEVRKSAATFLDQRYLESSQTNLSLSNHFISNEIDFESLCGDNACGEPFIPQHIFIDFTPDKTIDTEFVQNKVSDFWDFVDAHPELQACIVKPDIPSEFEAQNASSSKFSPTPSPSTSPVVGPSAVSMMSMITKRGIVNPALNLTGTSIPDTDSTYFGQNKLDSSKIQRIPLNIKSPKMKSRHGNHTKVKLPRMHSPYTSEEVKKMCESLSRWDELHPKTLDPPGQTPSILPAI